MVSGQQPEEDDGTKAKQQKTLTITYNIQNEAETKKTQQMKKKKIN